MGNAPYRWIWPHLQVDAVLANPAPREPRQAVKLRQKIVRQLAKRLKHQCMTAAPSTRALSRWGELAAAAI